MMKTDKNWNTWQAIFNSFVFIWPTILSRSRYSYETNNCYKSIWHLSYSQLNTYIKPINSTACLYFVLVSLTMHYYGIVETGLVCGNENSGQATSNSLPKLVHVHKPCLRYKNSVFYYTYLRSNLCNLRT